ncbi:type II secretion system F family protein [Myxococcota bacterium]|nr:type II secretion system F family protein [Myxococcota bacterium]
MAFFRYVALDENGAEREGTVEASASRDAATVVRAQGLRMMRITEITRAESSGFASRQYSISDFLPISLADRVQFFQQMALMLRSGLSVLQALEVARELTIATRLKRSISRVAEEIKGGAGFSAAMEAQGSVFPLLATQLIRSAESSGELDTVLERIADHLEQKATTRRNLITSLVYPGVVVLVSIGVAFFLLTSVVPKFAAFFERSNKTLPPLTQALVDWSSALAVASPYIGAVSAVGMVVIFYSYSRPQGRIFIDRFLLKIPIVGPVLMRSSLAQLTWALAMLLRSGVSILDSLRVGTGVVSNKAIESALELATEDLLAGRDFASSINRRPLPSLVIRLSAVGERAGSLEQVMQELGDHYDQELQASIKRMSNLIEPVLMLIIGSMVGFVYFAFFQAVIALA